MIYTVTLNPAIDCAMSVGEYRTGAVNRADTQALTAGGKGINMSVILSRLGVPTVALGFIGGVTGKMFLDLLEGEHCPHEMTEVEGQLTRINFKLHSSSDETEINGKGPEVPTEVLSEFVDGLCGRLESGDTLILAGSIPASVPDSIYADIMKRLSGIGVSIAADTSGSALVELIKLHPFLIKPNNIELGEILGRSISTRAEAFAGALELQKMGAQNVLVSLASEGAVLLAADGKRFESGAPHGKAVNSVGAGDSMLAGYLAGLELYGDNGRALMLGTAAGSSTAFSSGLASRDEILAMFSRLEKDIM